MRSGNSLIIGTPYVETRTDDKVRLCSNVTIEGETKTIWFEVEEKYAKYLCAERSDAFVIGLLPIAMRRQLDIVCEAPVNERLLFQLRSTLLPLLAKYGKDVHEVKIDAPVASDVIESAGGVGAGISCGVDSLHIVKNCSSDLYPGLKLTHLVLNNVGAFGLAREREQYEWTIATARRYCADYGYELIVTDSNIKSFVPSLFEEVHTYLNVFAVYCLQKLWTVFYYGSGGFDFLKFFTLRNHDQNDCASYDLLLLDALSTDRLKIYSEGVAYERIEKTAHIADFEPAQKYLQVCVSANGGNCGRCSKCVRTLLMLDYLGALDRFAAVFDIAAYRRNRKWYLMKLYKAKRFKLDHQMLDPVYEKFKDEIGVGMKIRAIYEQYLYCTKVALRPTFEKLGILKPKA